MPEDVPRSGRHLQLLADALARPPSRRARGRQVPAHDSGESGAPGRAHHGTAHPSAARAAAGRSPRTVRPPPQAAGADDRAAERTPTRLPGGGTTVFGKKRFLTAYYGTAAHRRARRPRGDRPRPRVPAHRPCRQAVPPARRAAPARLRAHRHRGRRRRLPRRRRRPRPRRPAQPRAVLHRRRPPQRRPPPARPPARPHRLPHDRQAVGVGARGPVGRPGARPRVARRAG